MPWRKLKYSRQHILRTQKKPSRENIKKNLSYPQTKGLVELIQPESSALFEPIHAVIFILLSYHSPPPFHSPIPRVPITD